MIVLSAALAKKGRAEGAGFSFKIHRTPRRTRLIVRIPGMRVTVNGQPIIFSPSITGHSARLRHGFTRVSCLPDCGWVHQPTVGLVRHHCSRAERTRRAIGQPAVHARPGQALPAGRDQHRSGEVLRRWKRRGCRVVCFGSRAVRQRQPVLFWLHGIGLIIIVQKSFTFTPMSYTGGGGMILLCIHGQVLFYM